VRVQNLVYTVHPSSYPLTCGYVKRVQRVQTSPTPPPYTRARARAGVGKLCTLCTPCTPEEFEKFGANLGSRREDNGSAPTRSLDSWRVLDDH